MKKTRFILLVLGVANIAAHSLSNIGFTDCSGLFLLHTSDKQFSIKQCGVSDTLEVQGLKVYGDYRHIAYQGRYTDQWDAKGTNKLDIATVGFESRFRYITLGVDVNNLPFVRSTLAVHRSDSLFRLSTSIARGSIELGNIRWIPHYDYNVIPEISVDWETHLLSHTVAAKLNPGRHHLGVSGTYLQSSPRNPDKQYYIRDSINVLIARGDYGVTLGENRLSLGYTYTNADASLYGIFHQETSRKRFLYIPLEAQLHWAYAEWNNEGLSANLNYIHAAGKISADQNRFFETLAPNRALPASVLKSLSFSFLQKLFRVDAELDASAFLGGATYQWHFGKKYSFNPSAGIESYYASGALDIDKQIETLILLTYHKDHETYRRELISAGGILSLGTELRRDGDISIALEYGITQLIPVYSSYKEFLPDESGNGNDLPDTGTISNPGESDATNIASQKKSGDLETKKGAAFRNGFATHLRLLLKI